MVATVTGNHLGLANGSATVLGKAGLLGSSAMGRATNNLFVNATTGNLVITRTDDILVGVGPDNLSVQTYNSQGLLDDDNADNWRPAGTRFVGTPTGTWNTSGSTITRTDWDGSVTTFTWDTGRSAYVSKNGSGSYDTLTYGASTWTFTDGDSRATETYDHPLGGRITSSIDAAGNALTYTYDNPGHTIYIHTDNGEYSVYNYTGNNLTSMQKVFHDPSSSVVVETTTIYTYDGSNRLSTVTVDLTPGDNSVSDNVKYVTTYTYHSTSNRVASISQTDGSYVTFGYTIYGSDYKVTSVVQTESSGVTRTTAYDYQSGYTKVTDPAGQDTYLYYDTDGQLTQITAPVAVSGGSAQDYQFTYDGDGNVLTMVAPSGATTTFAYDSSGNCTLERDDLGNTVTRTFGSLNEVLSETRYLTPDPDGAGVGTPSDPLTTRYVYDAQKHLRFVIQASGAVMENRYDGNGQLTRTYRYTDDRYTTSGTPSQSTMASWVSGLSDKSLAQMTEWAYDYRGNLTSETIYSVLDSSGDGDTGETYSVKNFVYDQHGQLLSAYRPGDTYYETYVYDGLGRNTSFTNRNNDTTTTTFTDASSTTAVTLSNGLVQTSVYNLAGRLISSASSGTGLTTGTTTLGYDTLNQVGVVVDANGNYSYALYDHAGRKTADVDATGAMVEYKYNADNQVIATVRYATVLGSTPLASLHSGTNSTGVAVASVRPSGTSDDVWTWNIYDDAGRVVETINGLGGVTTYAYDGASQLVKTTQWATAISSGTVSGYKTTLPTSVTTPSSSGDDRVTRFFYDDDGRQIGMLDATGALTEIVYDAAGRVVETIAYATITGSGHWASGSFSTLQGDVTASVNGDDVHNWTLYDARGLIGATINGEGEITRYTYDANNNLVETVEGQRETVATFITTRPTLDTLPSVTGSPVLRTTTYTYDAYGRVLTIEGDAVYTTGNTLVTSGSTTTPTITNVYDDVGNLIQTTDANGNSTWFYYDKLGRKTAALDALGTLSTWTYNAGGLVTSAKVYGSAFSLPGSPGGSPPSVGATAYRETTFAYDAASRLFSSSVASVYTGEYASGSFGVTTGTVTSSVTYNGLGQVAQTTDGRGNSAYSFYDVLGRVIATVDEEKYLTYTTYNAQGDVTKVERFATAVSSVSTSSDPATLRSGVSGGAKRVTDYTYDKAGRVLTIGVEGMVASSVNTSTGVLTIGSAGTVTTTLTYNVLGQVETREEATGDETGYTYDRAGRVLTVTGEAFTDYASNSVRSMVVTTYNGLGLVTSTTLRKASGTSGDDQTTTYTYGAGGRLATVTNAEGFDTDYGYDAAGRVTKTSYTRTLSDGSTTVDEADATRYDALGRVIYQGQATWGGSSWTVDNDAETTYTVFGEVASTKSNGVTQTQNYYDDAGRLWKTNAGGVATLFLYDKNGQVSATINTAGATDLTGYSLSSAVTALTHSGANLIGAAATTDITVTISVRDKRGMEVQTRLPYRELTQSGGVFSTANLSSSRTYNAFGEVTQSTDTMGGVTDYTYNTLGKVIKVESPTVDWTAENGTITTTDRPTQEMFYDVSGRLVATEDANAHVAGTAYYTTRVLQAGSGYGGSAARTIKEFHADGGVAAKAYDVYGAKRSETNEIGKTTTYAYDKLNRLITVTHPTRPSGSVGNTTGSNLTLVDHYIYDELGERVAHWNSQLTSSVKEYTDYDNLGRVISSVDYSGYETTYGYSWSGSAASSLGTFGAWTRTTTNAAGEVATDATDNFGRTVDHVDFGGHDYDYTYNAAGWLTLTENKISSTVYEHIETSWYNSGLTATVIDNATNYTVELGTHYKTTYNYDAAGRTIREIELQHYASSPTTVMDAQTTYDALGRITSFDDTGMDANNAASVDYEYDLNGNVRRTYATWKNQISGATDSSDHWNKFDNMNRFVTTGGTFTGSRGSGTISRGLTGTDVGYNVAGQRVYATTTNMQNVEVSKTWVAATSGHYEWEITGSNVALSTITEGPYGGFESDYYAYGDPDENGNPQIGYSNSSSGPFIVPVYYGWVYYPPVAAHWDYTYADRDLGHREEYVYTADGYLAQTRGLDGTWNTSGYTVNAMAALGTGAGTAVLDDERDAMGRLIERTSAVSTKTYTYDDNGDLTQQTDSANHTQVDYTYTSGSDYIGQIVTAVTTDTTGTPTVTNTVTNTYAWWEGAQKAGVSQTINSDTQTYLYDTGGNLVRETINDTMQRSLFYVTRASGEVAAWYDTGYASSNSLTLNGLLGSSPWGHALTYYSGNRRIGEAGNDGQTGNLDLPTSIIDDDAAHLNRLQHNTAYADFDQGYAPVSTSNPGNGASGYTVRRNGETLANIAQKLWGDGSLWWILAEANGLQGNERLGVGDTLVIPAKVTNVRQSSSTSRPGASIYAYTSFVQAVPDYSGGWGSEPGGSHGSGGVGGWGGSSFNDSIVGMGGNPFFGMNGEWYADSSFGAADDMMMSDLIDIYDMDDLTDDAKAAASVALMMSYNQSLRNQRPSLPGTNMQGFGPSQLTQNQDPNSMTASQRRQYGYDPKKQMVFTVGGGEGLSDGSTPVSEYTTGGDQIRSKDLGGSFAGWGEYETTAGHKYGVDRIRRYFMDGPPEGIYVPPPEPWDGKVAAEPKRGAVGEAVLFVSGGRTDSVVELAKGLATEAWENSDALGGEARVAKGTAGILGHLAKFLRIEKFLHKSSTTVKTYRQVSKGLTFADGDKSTLSKVMKSMKRDGIKDPVINYVSIDGRNYIVSGNNRVRAAQQLGMTDQLQFVEVGLPYRGYKDAEDVVIEAAKVMSGRR